MLTLKQKNLWSHRIPYLAAGTALAMTLLSHAVLHRPVAQRLAEVTHRIVAAREELGAIQMECRELPEVERDVQRLRQKTETANRLPQRQDWGQFIREVTSFGEATSLSKFTVQPGVPRTRELVYEVPVSLSFQSDYLSACGFLRNVEEMSRLTSMNGLTVHVVDPTVGRVEVQLSMNLYFADGY